MAGHSKFKNIQHRKGAQDKKRAKVFTKLVREIIIAAKLGGVESANNPKLRTAIAAARSHNLPKERIDRAIKQASDPSDSDNYNEIRYEAFLPGGIAIIIEALTDNKNRTASDVRSAISKHGGNLGETGSVSFMFDRLGIITYSKGAATNEEMLEAAIEAGARDVESDDETHVIYTDIDGYTSQLDFLNTKFGTPLECAIKWHPQNTIVISDIEKAEKILKLLDALEDSDDVQDVFGNYEFTDDVYDKLNR